MIVTPLYAGLLGLWFFVLSVRVVQGRGRFGINLGDGGNVLMIRRIRGHANFVEYVPLTLLLIAILEFSHFSIYLIHALGLALLIGRVLHGYAFGFTEHSRFGRMWGTALSFLVLLIAAGLCTYQGLRASALWY
ncbi:MAPEG family protein [Solimonas terrae]|uniref:Glutathione metabolism protein n=1 Tax=Solimonas terrae TaxID=1396819 RepID=A0A6M2BSC4_9GAMM|nr:MAPEG family protein [Solimonas terrae]NGY05135.1 glutathione metabolism protein [Solimonas terrae]